MRGVWQGGREGSERGGEGERERGREGEREWISGVLHVKKNQCR